MDRHLNSIITFTVLCALCVSAVTSIAAAQPGHQRNAATWYQQALDHLRSLPREDWRLIMHTNPAEPPTPELRAALARAAPVFAACERGAREEWSDFGFDRAQGQSALLTHLPHMRQVARAMETDAMVRLHDGDSLAAANRMANLYRVSVHLGDDRTVVGSLVASALCSLGERAVQHAMDHAALGPAEAAILLRETQRLAQMDDPFNYLGAAVADQELLVDWIGSALGEPDAAERIAEKVGPDLFQPENDRTALFEQIAALSRDEFDTAVAQFDAMTDRVVQVFAMQDPDAARRLMAELSEDFAAGEHGPLAMLASYWSRALDNRLYTEEMLYKRVESLRAIAQGEIEPAEMANAAVWYGRAIQMIEQTDPDALELLREFSAENEVDAQPDERTPGLGVEPLLVLSQDIIDVLREGSTKRRCDFSILWRHIGGPAPVYAPGMRDAFRLVHADALRLLRRRDFDAAADRLAIGYRMIGHLCGDPHIVSSIVAHRSFLEAHALIEFALDIKEFSADHRRTVLAGYDRIDVSDPFGYLASHRTMRAHTVINVEGVISDAARHPAEAAAGAPLPGPALMSEDGANGPSPREVIDRAGDAAILSYYAVMQFYFRAQREQPLGGSAGPEAEERFRTWYAALHDVLSIENLLAVNEDGRRLAQEFRESGHFALHDLDVRPLNPLCDRRHRARADLRATASLLRERAAPDETGSDSPTSR